MLGLCHGADNTADEKAPERAIPKNSSFYGQQNHRDTPFSKLPVKSNNNLANTTGYSSSISRLNSLRISGEPSELTSHPFSESYTNSSTLLPNFTVSIIQLQACLSMLII